MLQDMLELLKHKDEEKTTEVIEAVAATSQRFEVEADHQRQSAAKVRFHSIWSVSEVTQPRCGVN